MSAYLEEQVLRVDLLLDILEGEHLLSRRELAGSPSGPGGGYEKCPQCWHNKQLGRRTCDYCHSSGWVRVRGGKFDAYVGAEVEMSKPQPQTSRSPITNGELTSENVQDVLERAWANRNGNPPPTRERAQLSRVEHSAASDEIPRLRKSLDLLVGLMHKAEEGIIQSALRREREGLMWFAKRMPRHVFVPGL